MSLYSVMSVHAKVVEMPESEANVSACIRETERRPAKFWHHSQLDDHLEEFPPLN